VRPAPWPTSPLRARRTPRGHAHDPFYIFYSMFGFQRTGTGSGRSAHMRGRGFFSGHRPGHHAHRRRSSDDDGHSLVLASAVPTCRPTTRLRL